MKNEERGSTKMMEELLGQRTKFSKKDLAGLLELAREKNARLVDWHIYGQPADMDGLHGSFQVDPAHAGDFVGALLGSPLRFRVEIFPYGIKLPDYYQVAIQAGRGPMR